MSRLRIRTALLLSALAAGWLVIASQPPTEGGQATICEGYTIIEYGKAVDCHGDTVILEKRGGLQVLSAAQRSNSPNKMLR